MLIKANDNFYGALDLSSLERLQESNPIEKEPMRLTIRPNESIEIDDKFYTLTNIQNALKHNYIEIEDYDQQDVFSEEIIVPESTTTNYNLTKVRILNRADYPQEEFGKLNVNMDEIDTLLSSGIVGATWGNILGTLSNQTDLQNALDLKYNAIDFDSDFDTNFGTKTTDNLTEGSNLYYTDTRAISALNPHTSDSTIHFEESSINHNNILNVGINTHSEIDTFIGTTIPNTYVPYTGATTNVDLGNNDLKQENNAKHYFGTGDNASIYYDDTDLCINSKEAGSGELKIISSVYIEDSDPTTDYSGQLVIQGTANSGAENTGAGLLFQGKDGLTNRIWGVIQGLKENSIEDNYDGYLSFITREDGHLPREVYRITSEGHLQQSEDNQRFYQGAGKDYSQYFDGTNQNFELTSGDFVFNSNINAPAFVTDTGTSSDFVKGDGSLDSNTYLTTATASTTYVPYTGATTNVDLGNNDLKQENNAKHYFGTSDNAYHQYTGSYYEMNIDGSRYLHNYGTENTFLGAAAGNFSLTGDANVVIGTDAGKSLTDGRRNVFVGEKAGEDITTGDGNVAVGRTAMGNATTATSQVAVGEQALYSVSTGTGNVGVGWWALRLNTTGSNNMAVGQQSLSKNTTGSNNIGVGYQALRELTEGNHNSAIGQQTLVALETGEYNTAIGSWALYNCVNNNNNTSIGYATLFSLVTGAQNVALGDMAGRYINSGSNLTDADDSIFIGHDARANSESETNQIVIGTDAMGKGSNTTVIGNSNMTGLYLPSDDYKLYQGAGDDYSQYFDGTNQNFDLTSGDFVFSGGNVGIGTLSPSPYKLYVDGGGVDTVAMFESTDSYADVKIKDSGGTAWVTSASGNLVLQRTGGNVGIGTDSPDEKLEVNGNIYLQGNDKALFGTGKDASIYYDGTDLNINTQEAGSGDLVVSGGSVEASYKSSDGSAGWTGTFTNGDGDTVTVKDGIITSVA